MILGTNHNLLMEALEAESFVFKIPTFTLVNKLWEIVKRMLGYWVYTEFSPIWNNKHLKEVEHIEKCKVWEGCGLVRLVQLYSVNWVKLDMLWTNNWTNKSKRSHWNEWDHHSL